MVSMGGIMPAPGGPTEDPTNGFKFGGWVMPYFDQEFGEELDRLFKRSPADPGACASCTWKISEATSLLSVSRSKQPRPRPCAKFRRSRCALPGLGSPFRRLVMKSEPRRFLNYMIPMLLAVVASAACDALSIGGEQRQVGTISFYHDPIVIDVPDTVSAGASFTVSVRTYGGGCVRQGETELVIRELSAEIRPYDIHTGANVCTDILKFLNHQTAVQFNRTGRAEVRIIGRREPEDTAVVITRTVEVR
jgi:hypothetical protein